MRLRNRIVSNRKLFSLVGIGAAVLVYGWLGARGTIDPLFGLLYRLHPVSFPALADSPRHASPDLSGFPSQLDDLAIVAHADDESLAVGGFLASEVRTGKSVGVVVVSFSEGQEHDQRNWYGVAHKFRWYQWPFINSIPLKPGDRTEYGRARERESEAALDFIGVPAANRLFLRYPDLHIRELLTRPDQPVQGIFTDPLSGQVEQYVGSDLKATLREIVARTKPHRIITHFSDDTNGDHQAIGRFILDDIAPNSPVVPTVWTFLVHWSVRDEGWVPLEYNSETAWLKDEPKDLFQVPNGSPTLFAIKRETVAVPWTGNFTAWKAALINTYASQVRFDPDMLRLFAKKNELFWNQLTKTLYDVRFGE